MKTAKIASFSTRIEIRGESAEKVRKILDAKMKEDNRKTYTNTIESIILDYGESIIASLPKPAKK